MILFPAVVGLYLGSLGWVDISEDVRLESADSAGGITITRGRANESQHVDPGTASLVINNRHGKYSPRNPRSEYYGLIGRNTPIRIGVRVAADAFDRTLSGGWGTADEGGTWYRWGESEAYAVDDGEATITHSTINTLRGIAFDREYRDVEQVTDIATSAMMTGGALVAGHMVRWNDVTDDFYHLRCEFNGDSSTVTARITKRIGGSTTTLAQATNIPGVSYSAGVPLRVRSSVAGARLAIKIWQVSDPEPRDWTLTAVDTTLTAGRAGMLTYLVSTVTNTLPVTVSHSNYLALDPRYVGEVSSWPSRWDLSGRDVWVPIEAAGILRRLGQGARPVSALSRAYAAASPQPIAWWPLEDGPNVDRAASGLPDGPPMVDIGKSPSPYSRLGTPEGEVVWGVEGSGGAAALVGLENNGRLAAPIPPSSSTAWTVEFVVRYPAKSELNAGSVPMTLWAQDSYEWSFLFSPDGLMQAAGGTTPPGGTAMVVLETAFNAWDGLLHHVRLVVEHQGAHTAHYLYLDGELRDSAYWFDFLAPVPDMFLPNAYHDTGSREAAIGHPALFDFADHWDTARPRATQAWAGEGAVDRISRLCAENGVPLALVDSNRPSSTPMGPQRVDTLLTLLRECADADVGILYEQRADLGLAYRTRASLYNQAPVTLDYAAGHISPPFEPLDDDDAVRNDIEVSRPEGSSARSIQRTGPLSVLPPPDGVGTYDESITVNVSSDVQLPDQAGWRRHLGTWDAARYPRITIDLAATAWRAGRNLAALAVAADTGDRLAVDNLPDWLPPGPADVIVQGYTERLDAYERTITWNATPAGPWDVATAGGVQRVPTVGSTLAAPLADGEMTASLACTVTRWVTDSAHFPLRLRIGGEEVEVSAISGTSSPQTATIAARGLNGITRSWPAGTPVQVSDPAIVPL